MIAWLLRDRKAAPVFKLSASDLARDLAKLGAEKRRVEHRRRVLLTTDLLRTSGAVSSIAPTPGWQ